MPLNLPKYPRLPAWVSPSIILPPSIHFLDFILSQPAGLLSSVPASPTRPSPHYPSNFLRADSLPGLTFFSPLSGAAISPKAFSVTIFLLLLHPLGPAPDDFCLPCFDVSGLLYPPTLGTAFCLWGHGPSGFLYLLGYFCCYPQVAL